MYEQIAKQNCIYETCRYLLILMAKNAIANKFQQLSKQTIKQKYICED